jgi:hypothetical protein
VAAVVTAVTERNEKMALEVNLPVPSFFDLCWFGRGLWLLWLRVEARAGPSGDAGEASLFYGDGDVVVLVGVVGRRYGDGDVVEGRSVGGGLVEESCDVVAAVEDLSSGLEAEDLEGEVADLHLVLRGDAFGELFIELGVVADGVGDAAGIDAGEGYVCLQER